jgi:hypothetical protein
MGSVELGGFLFFLVKEMFLNEDEEGLRVMLGGVGDLEREC